MEVPTVVGPSGNDVSVLVFCFGTVVIEISTRSWVRARKALTQTVICFVRLRR